MCICTYLHKLSTGIGRELGGEHSDSREAVMTQDADPAPAPTCTVKDAKAKRPNMKAKIQILEHAFDRITSNVCRRRRRDVKSQKG